MLNYCRELNVPLEVFLNDSDANYFYFEGNAAGALSNKRIRMREVKADLTGAVNELLVKAIDQKKLDLPLTEEDQKRLTNYLVNQGYLDRETRSYRAFENRGEGDPYQLAQLLQGPFSNRLRSVPALEGTTAAPMFQPIGGMDQIAKGFQRAMDAKRLTFNAEVQSVHPGRQRREGHLSRHQEQQEDRGRRRLRGRLPAAQSRHRPEHQPRRPRSWTRPGR